MYAGTAQGMISSSAVNALAAHRPVERDGQQHAERDVEEHVDGGPEHRLGEHAPKLVGLPAGGERLRNSASRRFRQSRRFVSDMFENDSTMLYASG